MKVNQKGVALLEVVIAMFIVGFGLVAVAMFSTGLFSESGQVKARTEALQYAQEEIESVRNTVETDDTGIAAIAVAPAPRTVSGTNADFTITRAVNTVADPGYVDVAVTVSWTGTDGNDSVSLNSIVTASDADAVSGLVAGSLVGGGFIDEPLGTAEYVTGKTISDFSLTDSDKVTEGLSIPVGTSVYKKEDTYYVADESGNVLLKNDSNFNQVVGRVVIDAGHSVTENNIEVVPSDTGVCRKGLTLSGDTDMTTIYSVASGGTSILKEVLSGGESGTQISTYFEYACFFGSGWYGSIGILRNDSASTGDRSCGGDPTFGGDDGTDISRHPQLMATRTYRGFTPQIDPDTNVPFVDSSNNWIYLSTGMISGHVYGSTSGEDGVNTHDFLLTRITGTATDSDCTGKLTGTDHDSNLTAGVSYFKNNSGNFVCIVDADLKANCPDVIPTGLGEKVSATAYTYNGKITSASMPNANQIDGLKVESSQGGACSIGSWSGNDTDGYEATWTCDVYHYTQTGDSGTILTTGWTGQIGISSSADNIAEGETYESVEVCSVTSYNVSLQHGTAATGISFTISPSSCPAGTTYVTIAGSVENISNSKTIDLSGSEYFVEAIHNGTSINCGSLANMAPDDTVGFSCSVPSGFTGTVSISTDLPGNHRVRSDLDFSSETNGVTTNLSGQLIEIQ